MDGSVIEKKILLLKELFPSFRIRKGNEFVTFCPSKKCKQHNSFKSDPKKKLEVNLENNRFSCWVCHYKGHALKLFTDHGTKVQKQKYAQLCGLQFSTISQERERDAVELPGEYKFIFDSESLDANAAIKWIGENNINFNSVLSNRLGICSSGRYKNRIIFPSFDSEFRLNYFITRHLYEDGPFKWLKCDYSLKKIIFNECFVNWKRPVILVESVKTYLKNFDKINNMIVCNGSFLSREYLLFNKIIMEDVPSVFVAFDEDAKENSLDLISKFNEFGVESFHVDIKGQADDLFYEEFNKKILSASQYNKIDLLKDRILNLI